MKIIVVTPPRFVEEEGVTIARLLQHGVWAVHLRKPQCAAADMARLIEQVPAEMRPRLVLHDHLHLCAPYGLMGVHLNRRNAEPPPGHRGTCSRSVHGIDELRRVAGQYHYVLLSPIYDSISKEGYGAAYTADQLAAARSEGLIGERVMALGGVSLQRLDEVRRYGFGGAALLGDVWQRVGTPCFADYLERLKTVAETE